jgi:hypothetical protein
MIADRKRNHSEGGVRAFVIWEPVLAIDFAAPSTSALSRIPDLRVAQYWDRKRALSRLLGEHNRSTVVWDHIAVYAPGTLWHDALPKPVYSDNPVGDVIGGAKDAIQRLLASGVNSAGGEKWQRTLSFIPSAGECFAIKRKSIFRKRALRFKRGTSRKIPEPWPISKNLITCPLR